MRILIVSILLCFSGNGRQFIPKNYNRSDVLPEIYSNCNTRYSTPVTIPFPFNGFLGPGTDFFKEFNEEDERVGKIQVNFRAANKIIMAGITPGLTMPARDITWLLAVAGLLVTGIFGYRSRHTEFFRTAKKSGAIDEGDIIERERFRISRDLHDHIGSSLTRINLLCELAKRNESIEILDKISQTTLEVIQSMDEIVWVINPQNDLLNSLIDYIITYASEYFEGSGINCRFNLPAIFPEEQLRHEFRHNIFLTVKEALNNILKHSGAEEVNVNIIYSGKILEVEITDNGEGFNLVNYLAKGNGLGNMSKRIEDIGGNYSIFSSLNNGTKINIRVPLQG